MKHPNPRCYCLSVGAVCCRQKCPIIKPSLWARLANALNLILEKIR